MSEETKKKLFIRAWYILLNIYYHMSGFFLICTIVTTLLRTYTIVSGVFFWIYIQKLVLIPYNTLRHRTEPGNLNLSYEYKLYEKYTDPPFIILKNLKSGFPDLFRRFSGSVYAIFSLDNCFDGGPRYEQNRF